MFACGKNGTLHSIYESQNYHTFVNIEIPMDLDFFIFIKQFSVDLFKSQNSNNSN